MAEVIRMPKMSDTMEAGVVATWLKKVGDAVKVGDILAEIETDKATMELEGYEDGTLLYIGAKERETVPINAVLAIIGKPGEDITTLLGATKQLPEQQGEGMALAPPVTPVRSTIPTSGHTPLPSPPSILASPLAKKMAKEKGYALADIRGTGEGGRIIKRDVENVMVTPRFKEVLPNVTLPFVVGKEEYEDIPVSNMRKAIAKRLTDSKLNAPHFYLTVNIAMDQVVAVRPSINEYARVKVSVNDIVVKAAAVAIRQHLAINVAWRQDAIRYNKHIHMGIAVAVEGGLVVPVLHFIDSKSLAHIAVETKALIQKANEQQLRPKELEGSTFTISNLGMLGIESFAAIVNPPAACILAIGEIQQVPVVRCGVVMPGYVMKATLSCDHRAVDGAVGASFLQTFKALLEDPIRMLVH
ncbi:MAG: 2-oxo acid dehydrogenase subunit E2 [Amoebophilaceae bacterium]|nr:2-oxo acid dehydrogenase subunit E2 [Amoebophilaceae bacterium]